MNFIREEGDLIIVQCNLCKKQFTVKKDKCSNTNEGYEIAEKIRCEVCGQQDSSIIDYKRMLKVYNLTEKDRNFKSFEDEKKARTETVSNKNLIECPKCGSAQLTSNAKGFGLGKAIGGFSILGPLGILGGFIGSKKILITCLKCGNQWEAGSKIR